MNVLSKIGKSCIVIYNFVAGGCLLPQSCWDSNPGPLAQQAVLLTNEPLLQPSTPCHHLNVKSPVFS